MEGTVKVKPHPFSVPSGLSLFFQIYYFCLLNYNENVEKYRKLYNAILFMEGG